MAIKVAFLFVIAFMISQAVAWSALGRGTRDTETQDASKTIDDLLNTLKTSFEDIITKVYKNNEIIGNASISIQEFGNQLEVIAKKVLNGKDSTTK